MGRIYVAREPEEEVDTLPPTWPPGWDFPGPPWPPGWDELEDEELTNAAAWTIGRTTNTAGEYPPSGSLTKNIYGTLFGHWYQQSAPSKKAMQMRQFFNFTIPAGYASAYGYLTGPFSRDAGSEFDGYRIRIYKLDTAIAEPSSASELAAAWSAPRTLIASLLVDSDSVPKAPSAPELSFFVGPFDAGSVTILMAVDAEMNNLKPDPGNTWRQMPDIVTAPTLTLYG